MPGVLLRHGEFFGMVARCNRVSIIEKKLDTVIVVTRTHYRQPGMH